MGDEVVSLRAELERTQQALAVLQRNFDEFHESSREVEEELEAELARTNDEASGLERRLAEVATRLGETQGKNRALNSELASAQAETVRMREAAVRAAAEKRSQEQSLDDLENKCRAALASEEDARHKLDLALEEKVFLSDDFEDYKEGAERKERKLKVEMEDLRRELERLKATAALSEAGGSHTPPNLVLPASAPSSDAGKGGTMEADEGVVSDEVPLLFLRSAGDGSDGAEEGQRQQKPSGDDVDAANEVADELIKALEEEVEILKGELREAEASNDELNEELQLLQEQLMESSIKIGIGGGTEADSKAGGNGESEKEARDEIQRLKDELSEAMATCEELDQTVTELTDDVQEKDSKRSELADRVDKLEAELGSRTQRFENETLAAKGREDLLQKEALTAKGREDLLRKENASLSKRISDLTTSNAELTSRVSELEAQLEEAQLASATEQDSLRKDLETLSVRLEEETASRRLAEEAAVSASATAAAAEAEKAKSEELMRKGQSSKEQEDALTGMEDKGRGRDREAELEGQVAKIEAALEEAHRANKALRGSMVDVGCGVGGGRRMTVSAALESNDVGAVKQELRSAMELYGREKASNASLLSKIRALRGNIEVICRIRPPTAEERSAGVPIALETLGDGEVGVKTFKDVMAGRNGSSGGVGSWRSFTLDKAFGPWTSQEEVFQQVEPLALSAADGMNACIFAYGQTGSGKTHTMIGDAKGGEMAGVSYRTMNKLFEVLELRQSQQLDYSFSVKVAMLEIYNEEVRDLLSSNGNNAAAGDGVWEGGGGGVGGKLEIRRDQEGAVKVPGLTYVTVTSAGQVLTLLERGGSARAVAATGVHDHSSRSHSVLMAEVSCRASAEDLPSNGRLFLVDLAGSERIKVSGVTGAGLREATNINSSLSALGDVMQALDQKQKHVPYRNSKLTYLLQDALGGNSRTAMVVTVCPTTLNVDETLFALQFATRARNVSLGPAHRNVGAKNLLEEGKELRAKLKEAARKKEHAEEALASLRREHARSQQKMAALLESRAKNSVDIRHQLEYQIETLKAQQEASQGSALEERSRCTSFQAEVEDKERQLKRSLAKSAALAKDLEERDAKLRTKQEEVAGLRKLVSETKTTVRRMSAGRISSGGRGRSYGGSVDRTARNRGEGKGEGVAPSKDSPHTPSKNLIEAKHRYNRVRQSTPGGMQAPSFTASPFTSVSPAASASTGAGTVSSDPRVHSVNGYVGGAEVSPPRPRLPKGRDDRPISVGCDPCEDIGDASGWNNEDGVGFGCGAESTTEGEDEIASHLDRVGEAIREEPYMAASVDDDFEDTVDRVIADFAGKSTTRVGGGDLGVKSDSGGIGRGGDRKGAAGRKRDEGARSRLMKGTASSMSRLRLPGSSSISADEGSRVELLPPRVGRASGVTPRAGSTPREALRPAAPSPASRLSRPNSFPALSSSAKALGGSIGSRSNHSGGSKAKTPRVRNSFSGPMSSAAPTAVAASSSVRHRKRTTGLQPPSPAHARGGSSATASSKSSPSHGVFSRGWLGEKSSRSGGGSGGFGGSGNATASTGPRGASASSRAPPGSTAITSGLATEGGNGSGGESKAEGKTRAQLAFERHQARMDRQGLGARGAER